MTQVPAWFDRTFIFTFPVAQYPNLCARLRGTPARLEEVLQGVVRETLTAKTPAKSDSKWSAQEEAGHLLDMEPLWLTRVEDFVCCGDTLTPADLSNRRTHEANHNASDLAAIIADFRTARLRLVERLSQLEPDLFAHSLLHPRLKQPMRLVDHLYFVAEHDDHHLASIWEKMQVRKGSE